MAYTIPSEASKVPNPFLGRFPTRISIFGTKMDTFEGKIHYIGKPVPAVLQYFKRLWATNSIVKLSITEFDQNGMLRSSGKTERYSAPFCNLYHPLPRNFWDSYEERAKLYLLLDRKLVRIQNKPVYVNSFWQGTDWEKKAEKMLKAGVNGRIENRWFTARDFEGLAELIHKKAYEVFPAARRPGLPPPPAEGAMDRLNRIMRRRGRPVIEAPTPPPGRGVFRFDPVVREQAPTLPPINPVMYVDEVEVIAPPRPTTIPQEVAWAGNEWNAQDARTAIEALQATTTNNGIVFTRTVAATGYNHWEAPPITGRD